jgi:protein phosphatase 1 regulatory subunit 37
VDFDQWTTHRSRSWLEEEGEIFRKGNVLLGPEELEGEYAGEELRREVRFLQN